MSDSESDEEVERIRAEKRKRLRERLEDGAGNADGRSDSAATGAESPDEPVTIADEDHFAETLASAPVVLVDFYADWCGPCRMLAPTLETIAADSPALVAKVDTEAHPELAGRYGVRGLPTLQLFVEGEPAERLVGVQDESRIRTVIERHAPSA